MITNELFKQLIIRNYGGKLPIKILIALSGGVDSMCLTFLLSQYRDKFEPNLEISAITIDHQYRNGSTEEAKDVGRIVKKWGVNHIVETLKYDNVDVRSITNFEEVARTKRYEAFQKNCVDRDVSHLAIAHTLNDQLETFLQRLQQNSSLYGLMGLRALSKLPIEPKSPSESTLVLRPLLDFKKSEIIETCMKHNIQWFEDHTNSDINLTRRNYLRHLIDEVIPHKSEDKRWSILSKPALIDTHKEIVAVSKNIQIEVDEILDNLKSQNGLKLHSRNALIEITLPKNYLEHTDVAVLSRMLYQTLYTISSIQHYYWAYAKVERKVIPRILNWFNTSSQSNDIKPLSMTYLNLMIKMFLNPRTGNVSMFFSRQPLISEDISRVSISMKVGQTWSEWVLFDKRFWIRLRQSENNLKQVSIEPYTIAKSELLTQSFPDIEFDKRTLEGVPLILTKEKNKILSIPTYGIGDSAIEYEWNLKENHS